MYEIVINFVFPDISDQLKYSLCRYIVIKIIIPVIKIPLINFFVSGTAQVISLVANINPTN